MTLTALAAALTAPLAFASRGKTARQLFQFALAEHESMLELRAAAARTSSPERRALYLKHALDEDRHATTFTAHAADLRRSLGRAPWGHPRTDCEGLFERLGEAGFLAFVHRGERRGRIQFETYAAHFGKRGETKLRALFQALVTDEREHERYTRDLLVACAGGEVEARRALRRVALWEAFRTWRRAGQGLAGAVYFVSMMVLYSTLLPFVLLVRLVRPRARGWQRGAT